MNVLATQKALFTARQDFETLDIGSLKVNPYQYFDGENLPNDVAASGGSFTNSIEWLNGTPTIVDGVRGKASQFSGQSLIYHNWDYPALNKVTISMFVKLSASDLSGWKILGTNRGDGFGDYGLHLALYNGQVNARVYGDGGSLNVYSTDVGQIGKTVQADTWYHIALVIDPTQTNNFQVIVNGEAWIQSSWAFPITAFERSFTIGDMNGTYPFNGIIDEVMYLTNDDAFSVSQAIEYHGKVSNGEFVDYWTTDGSLRLSNETISGAYPTTNPVSWYSSTIALGESGFVDFGYIEAVGQLPSTATTLSFYTRTSADGVTWEEWRQVDIDGKILSTNQPMLQVRVDLQTTDGMLTPQLDELRIMQEIYIEPIPDIPDTKVRSTDPLELYLDLETGLHSLGVVKNAYDIIIEEQVNAEDNMTFKLPKHDKKRKEIGEEPVEMVAVIANRHYIVKEVIDKRDDDGKLYSEFICEAQWTELRDWYCDTLEMVEVSAQTALETIVANVFREEGDPEFDWTIGHVEIQKKRTLRSDWADVLSLVREVQNTWGGEVLFDNETKTIHLLEQIGKNAGVRFYYNKNLKNIERTIDTYDLVTRIYPTGKGELDISTVNGGVKYIENRTWVDRLKLRRKIIPYRWKDERYTIPQNLLDDGQILLDEMSKPKVAYKTSVYDLSTLTGHEHETFELGDTVTAVDAELFDEEIVNRIVRRKLDVRKPENTEVELSQPMKTLADIQSRLLDDSIQNLVESDPLSTTDAQQMTVYNQLLNSRADEGINGDWVNMGTGFTFENVGFSGNWSFKVTPDFAKEDTLTQTIEGVSHRSSYTVSAAVASEGKITRGSDPNAFVGIKVLVYYEGETIPEVHYLAVPDVTNTPTGGA